MNIMFLCGGIISLLLIVALYIPALLIVSATYSVWKRKCTIPPCVIDPRLYFMVDCWFVPAVAIMENMNKICNIDIPYN